MRKKGEFLISSSAKCGAFWGAFVCLFVAASIPLCASAFKKDLEIGAHVGYSGTYTTKEVTPNIFDGLAVGAQVVYGITESVGISLDGTFDLHQKYQEYREEEVVDEKKASMKWVPNAKVEHFFVTTGAACLVYAVDITRFVPYFTAGFTISRSDRTVDGTHDASFAIGLRLGGGLDYFFKRWVLGAAVFSDSYYGGNSNLDRRLVFLLRASYVFHFGAEILAKK